MNIHTKASVHKNPWRAVSPVLHNGKYGSIILDQGGRMKALTSSTFNGYLFDESAIGAQSLVIVGTSLEIFEFLLSNQKRGIENRIKELPEIYMGIATYKPQERFKAVFPLGDALVNVASYFASTIPVPDWVTFVSSPTSLEAIRKSLLGLTEAQREKGEVLYVKLGYLPEDGMQKIATKSITFKQVAEAIQQRYKKP
ncbi:hypothetical protein [Pseudomonas syringae group sp. J309-1]|uniref:hypothetical protein n=1 Tax=Pseudomonas syringae group sp. J309-1 TaxID=3079588 RepID=UPI00290D9785|nr:hypothetical protein [Pseudomonas syringae group sp. J309-1]MDU8359919.1 hypothetical protein [Pseudomonas syringae group sp. J309-1]